MGGRAAPASVKSSGDELTVPIHATRHSRRRAVAASSCCCFRRENERVVGRRLGHRCARAAGVRWRAAVAAAHGAKQHSRAMAGSAGRRKRSDQPNRRDHYIDPGKLRRDDYIERGKLCLGDDQMLADYCGMLSGGCPMPKHLLATERVVLGRTSSSTRSTNSPPRSRRSNTSKCRRAPQAGRPLGDRGRRTATATVATGRDSAGVTSTPTHLGFDEFDIANQGLISRH
jgi:hypothetical protein